MEPEKLTRGPKFLRKCVNSVRDFAVASRVVRVIVRERYNASEPLHCLQRHTPGGELWTLVVGGSGSEGPRPFQLIGRVDDSDPLVPLYFIRVVYSLLDSNLPTGPGGAVFTDGDNPIFEFEVTSGADDGKVYGHVTKAPGAASSAWEINFAATVPAQASGEIYGEIGSYLIDRDAHTIDVSNAGYGPIFICRNWFSSDPVTYSFDYA